MLKVAEDRVTEIDRHAESVIFPQSVTSIGQLACYCGSITSLNLEDTHITIIETHAFSRCKRLHDIKFPASLIEICKEAFNYCGLLIEISFPSDSKLKIIGDRAL